MAPKRKKGKSHHSKHAAVKRDLLLKDESSEYVKIINMLGSMRVRGVLPDKTEVLCLIPGRFRKRCWMRVGDLVLVSKREYQNSVFDVIHKYHDHEFQKLSDMNEIPPFFTRDGGNENDNDIGVVFGEEEEVKKADKEFDFEQI